MTAASQPSEPDPHPREQELLEQSLADLELPGARPAFRASLREGFQSGFPGVSEMYENREDGASRTPAEGRTRGAGGSKTAPDPTPDPVEDRIRQSALAPPPRPEFRARLRAEFTAGRVGGQKFPERLEPAARRGRFRLLLGGVALAAAAAVLVVLAGPGFGPGEPGADSLRPVFDGGWRVATSAQDSGLVRVDGNLLTLGDRARIEAAWNAGLQLESGDTPLEFVHPDGLRLSLQPRTLTRLGEDRDVAASPAWSLSLEHGELLLATDEGYTGRPIAFATPDSTVLVTGTALSVMHEERGTCICVQHGTVDVRCLKSNNSMRVGEEETCFIYSDARAPFEGAFCQAVQEFGEAMRTSHIDPLRSFGQ